MCDWMVQVTLQDFYFPPAFQYRLVVSDDEGVARQMPTTSLDQECNLAMKNDRLPPFPEVSRFTASEITIVSDERGDYRCGIPRRVYKDVGTDFYFKPAPDESQYIREVQCHIAIANEDLKDNLRVSKLAGIVTSDDKNMTLGLLLEWIPSFSDLQGIDARRQKQFHARWRQ